MSLLLQKEKCAGIKKSGCLIPLFCIYSKNSLGIGDFADLKLLVDWCAQSGNAILQLLPMNETGVLSCPYDAVSSFAIEPSYISLEAIPESLDKAIQKKIKESKNRFLCASGFVNYAVKNEKLGLLQEMFALNNGTGPAGLQEFKARNAYWLIDFALYKTLKEHQGGKAWYDWEERYRSRDKKALDDFQKQHSREIDFQAWLQYHLYLQFKAARDYASLKGIMLKGDLPILVSRDSADVWQHPGFFKLGFAAGAPPDMYCAKGQRWGMPTNDWDAIAKDGYAYLKNRLRYAENFYDILRIDHVVGLFRIWSIPYSEPQENRGLNGFFDPNDESKWERHGREILSQMLEATTMFLCAEDLGVIPVACTQALRDFSIPGNDVQRWTKEWKIKHDFLEPEDYRSCSVAMLSTHDTTNWPVWWENEAGTVDEDLFKRKCSDHRRIDFDSVKDKLFDPSRSKCGRLRWREEVDSTEKLTAILGRRREELMDFIDLYENSFKEKEKLWVRLGLPGVMREKCNKEILRAALKMVLDASSVFCINTVIDWLYLSDLFRDDAQQYRINTPGTISEKNWSLKLPIPLEELVKHKVTKEIRKMVAESGRS